ncbi:general substrate transporter [Phellopilus nigrolimitatus]|nr:general substrate transporter [Phellopilus nigrolimitatus]
MSSVEARTGRSPPSSRIAKLRSSMAVYMHTYTLCTIFASIGGFLFGFDTGSIGPVTTMPQFLDDFAPISPTLQGLIVSSILITASTASLLAGSLSDRISRIYTFSVGGAIFAVGSAIIASASTLAQLLVGRCVAGVGEGIFLSVIIVYQCEIAPAAIRGSLACTLQLLVTVGVASGYFVCYGTVKIAGDMSWRIPFILQAIISAVFAVGSPFLVHSPRWLRHVGRHEDAIKAWTRLGLNPTEAEKEDSTAANEERADESRKDWKTELRQLWKKEVRKRTVLGCFIMGMQQLSGIDGVLYYAPVLFTQAGLSSTKAAFLASGVSGLLNVGCTIMAQPFQDKWGRRPLVLIGGSVIASCMLVIGSIYASNAHATAGGRWAVVVLIYVFVVAFSMSWALAFRIYASEIQPMRTRAAATSLGQAANWIVNWVVAFTTPLFLARSTSGPYFLFGACTALTVLVCAAFLPESKGVSLEHLDEIFHTSPWRGIVAQLRGHPLRKLPLRRLGSEAGTRQPTIAFRSNDVEMAVVPNISRQQSDRQTITEGKYDHDDHGAVGIHVSDQIS